MTAIVILLILNIFRGTLIFPTALYDANIADVVYMHVSTDGNQRNFFTRVCITRC